VNECVQDGVRADGLLALRERQHVSVRTSRASRDLGTLIDRPFRLPSITIGRARELLNVTAASASHNWRRPPGSAGEAVEV